MKRDLRRAAIACLAAVYGAPSFADDAAAERQRIRAERAQVQARYADTVRECNRRFVVTSCVEGARAERRQALNRLSNQELVLDQAERRQRAAQRAADIRAKQAHDEAAPRALPRALAAPEPASAPRLHLRVPRAPTSAGHPPKLSPQEEARNRAAFEQRQREAEAHRESVERRNAERAAKAKQPSRPLPLPEGASTPGP
jgi:hypothetical protein